MDASRLCTVKGEGCCSLEAGNQVALLLFMTVMLWDSV